MYLLRKDGYRDTYHLKAHTISNKLISKVSAQEKGEKVMTATNMCSNFGVSGVVTPPPVCSCFKLLFVCLFVCLFHCFCERWWTQSTKCECRISSLLNTFQLDCTRVRRAVHYPNISTCHIFLLLLTVPILSRLQSSFGRG